MTEDERQLTFDLFVAYFAGFTGDVAIEPEYPCAAHDLTERSWPSRRIENGEPLWQITDEGLAALHLNALTRSEPTDLN